MAAPELRLEVSLNLLGFRNEIRKLTNIAQSEFVPKINVKFNRQTLDAELNNLQRAIKRRVYRVEIGGNIDALPSKIKNLKEQLASIESLKIDLGIGAVKSLSKRDASKIKSDLRAEILGEQKKIYVPVSIKPSIVKKDVLDFKNAVQSKLSGITVKVKADLEAASISGGAKSRADINADVRRKLQEISEIGAQRMAGGGGGVTEAARRAQLKRSLETGGFDIGGLKDIGKQLGVAGVGRFKNVNNLIEKIVTESSIEMVKKYLDPQAVMRNPDRSGLGKVLDTFARGIFNMLGMDPASIRAQQQSSKPKPFTPAGLLPAAYRGIGPSAEPAGLLPPAYRGIGPSRNAGALPGTAFGRQKYLPTALGEELKEVLRGAANAFLDSIRQNIRAVTVTDMGAPPSRQGLLKGGSVAGFLPGRASAASVLELNNILAGAIREYFKSVAREIEYRSGSIGKTPLSTTPLLAQSRVAGLLPQSVGRTPSAYRSGPRESQEQLFARRTREAYINSAARAADIRQSPLALPPGMGLGQPSMMRAPSVPPSLGGGGAPPVPPSRGGGGGSFGGMQFNVPQLPGAGLVREIGTEFAFAAKQVLLFGTAYKALAFLQGFPGQVGNAVGALQSFRNTLGAISPSAAEAAASSQFILDVVDKYNTPIQSARDGFTKLYASMKPTGFSGDEIRDLFLGISQAAATFGMSAEKVDRVNYAFAQMASKGQVMSEELKGQLGDVLPGAMGIFAEAAGFTGPEAITKFSKALEDGAYKGAAMKTLLTNVGSIMRKEFGPGAEGAARTFQGVINRMQNSLTLLYESFEPVAVGFLNSVVMPLTKGVKTITDGFNAFFAGTQAKTAGGMVFAQELERLRPAFDGIRANVAALMPVLQSFGKTLLEIGKIALQIAGNPLVGYLGRLYLIVLPINMAMGVLRGLWASNALQLVIFNARVATGTGTLAAFRGMTAATGATSTVAAGQVRGFGLALRAALATTVVGLAVVGLGMIAEAFMTAGAKAEAARQKMSQFMDSVKQLGKVGDVVGATTAAATEKASAIRIKQAEALLTEIKAGKKTVSEAQMKELRALGLASNMLFVQEQGQKGLTVQGMLGAVDANIKAAQQGYLETQTRIVQATQAVTEAKKNQAKEEANLQNVDLSAGNGKPPKEKSLESYYGLQDTLAKNAADFAAAQTEEEFRHKIELLEMYYDIQETRANAYQKDAIRFEREMVMIEERRQEARLKAQLDVQRAQGSVAGGAMGAGATGPGATRLPGSISGRLDASGQNGADMPVALNNIMRSYHNGIVTEINRAGNNGNYVVVEFLDDLGNKLEATYSHVAAAVKVGQSVIGGQTIGRFDASGRTFGAHNSVDINTPGTNGALQRNRESAIARRSADILVTGRVQGRGSGSAGAAAAPVTTSQKRNAVAEQNTLQASIAETAAKRRADAKAVEEQIVAFEKYRAAAFPTVEQEMQNKLLLKRNELFRSGMTDERIDQEIKLYENQERGAAGLAVLDRLLTKKILTDTQYKTLTKELNQDIANQNNLLQHNATLIAQAKFDQTIKGIRDQVAMARSITPDQEMRTQIAQEGYVGDQAESVFQERKTLQGAQKLKEDMQGIASSIGNSFGTAFKGIITGSMTAQEALAGMFQSIADHFADMVAQMIAEWIKMMILKGIEAIINPMAGLGNLAGGAGAGLSSGFSAGAASAVPTDAAGWGASFGTSLKFANGGIAPGGFTAFANGGMVTGPTMGLVGEGRYNEAIVPLPDGKSIPVELAGGGSSSPTVIVNVDAKGSQVEGNEQNANQLGRVISAAVQTELIKQQRPGGLLAR